VQRKTWDTGKLKNAAVCSEYENHLSNKLKDPEETGNSEVEWRSIRRVMHKVTEEVVGEREARCNDEWFDVEYVDVTEQKDKNRQKMLQRYQTQLRAVLTK
jgi:hypothetical protein